MKIFYKSILIIALIISSLVILSMTAITTVGIWDGDYSVFNIIYFLSGIIGGGNLLLRALDIIFNLKQ